MADKVAAGPMIAETTFLQAYGRALTSWHVVEAASYKIYYHAMKGADPRLVSLTWFHIHSFDARITLLDRCLQFVLLNEVRIEHWVPIKKELDAQIKVRNLLVHGTYSVEHGDPPSVSGTPMITPDQLDAVAIIRKRRVDPNFRFEVDDVWEAAHDFQVLTRRLVVFLNNHQLSFSSVG